MRDCGGETLALGGNIGRPAAAGRTLPSLPSGWGAEERRDGAHKRVSGRAEDVTCNMLHSCSVKPKNAKLSPLIDYARGQRLVRVEAEGRDQG